jgi:hypothetical protein
MCVTRPGRPHRVGGDGTQRAGAPGAGFDVDDVEIDRHTHRHRALHLGGQRLHGDVRMRQQRRVDDARISQRHRRRADDVTLEALIMVEVAHLQQRAAQA